MWTVNEMRERAPKLRFFVRSAIRNGPVDLLPHWLDHYSRMGVDVFALTVHGGCQSENIDKIRDICKRCPVEVNLNIKTHTWSDEEIEEQIMPDHLRSIGCKGHECWVLHADLDEFNEYPAAINELAERVQMAGYPAFVGNFIDRISADGSLKEAQPDTPIGEQYPYGCHLSVRILGCLGRKVVLARSDVKVGGGHHYNQGDSTHWMRGLCHVHHFKWRAGIVERLQWGLQNTGPAGTQWGREATGFINYVGDHGKIDINDPRLAKEWMPSRPLAVERHRHYICPSP